MMLCRHGVLRSLVRRILRSDLEIVVPYEADGDGLIRWGVVVLCCDSNKTVLWLSEENGSNNLTTGRKTQELVAFVESKGDYSMDTGTATSDLAKIQ